MKITQSPLTWSINAFKKFYHNRDSFFRFFFDLIYLWVNGDNHIEKEKNKTHKKNAPTKRINTTSPSPKNNKNQQKNKIKNTLTKKNFKQIKNPRENPISHKKNKPSKEQRPYRDATS